MQAIKFSKGEIFSMVLFYKADTFYHKDCLKSTEVGLIGQGIKDKNQISSCREIIVDRFAICNVNYISIYSNTMLTIYSNTRLHVQRILP